MNNIDLCKTEEDNFPANVNVGGIKYPINSDYKIILRIIKIQNNDKYEQDTKNIACLELFFGVNVPVPENAMEVLNWFLRCADPQPEPSNSPSVMDYTFDGDFIYSSILQQYHIDIIRIPCLHWFDFCIMLDGLNETTPLSARIRTRTASEKGLKGDDLFNLKRAKRRIALTNNHIDTEQGLLTKLGL